MKKWLVFLVLGIFLLGITGMAFAKAANATLGSKVANSSENATDDNETEDDNETVGNKTVKNQIGGSGAIVNQTKTRIEDRTNLTFVPWQKRNESECMEGCFCRGAVVTCTTENGKIMTITAGRSGNIIVITVEKTNASTELELEQELNEDNTTTLNAKLSNGEKKEVKVMPDEAEEAALESVKLRACNSENNCNLTLKEEKNQLKYELQLERHSRILAIFQKKMQVKTEIDAETGEVTNIAKPWWAFIATEPRE